MKKITAYSLFALLSFSVFAHPLNEQSMGFYSNGELAAPDSLANEGAGFVKLFRERDRSYGSRELVNVLISVSQKMHELFPDGERLQMGDLAANKGGKITRHASHQNGLDADLVYYRMNHKEQDLANEEGFAEFFVEKSKLSDNFDINRNWEVMKLFAKSGLVQRVFMDPVIKKSLCQFAEARGEKISEVETLRMMRPMEGHDDHFHIRLHCPAKSRNCIIQEAPPVGDGCNEIYAQSTDHFAAE